MLVKMVNLVALKATKFYYAIAFLAYPIDKMNKIEYNSFNKYSKDILWKQ